MRQPITYSSFKRLAQMKISFANVSAELVAQKSWLSFQVWDNLQILHHVCTCLFLGVCFSATTGFDIFLCIAGFVVLFIAEVFVHNLFVASIACSIECVSIHADKSTRFVVFYFSGSAGLRVCY